MSGKLGVGGLNSAISVSGSGELADGAVDGRVEASESKTLGMNSVDALGLGDEVRVLDGASTNGNERKFLESGSLEMDNMYGGGRVAELKSRNHGWESWGVMDLVGRVLDGKFRMDNETEGVNISESGPEVNQISDIDAWQDIVGEPTSKHGIGIEEPIIDKDPDDLNLDFRVDGNDLKGNPQDSGDLNLDCRVGGNDLNGNPQDSIVPNEMVPDGRTEIEEEKEDALIPRERGECLTETEGEYYLWDLVWGKVRSHPWWPGQIFDPSIASDKAKSHCKRDRYLIAYFGDQTFAWNEVSKIRPFRMHFSQMEKQSNTDGFCCAVECALSEVAQRVELGLSCACLPQKSNATEKVQEVASAGIQEESTRRAGVDNMYGAASFSSGELMQFLQSLALSPNGIPDRLLLTTKKAQLLAFNRWKGFDHLPIYEECPRFLEDLSRSTLMGEAKESLQGSELENTNNFPSKKRKMTVHGSYFHKRRHLPGGVGIPKELFQGPGLEQANNVPSKKRKKTVHGSYSQMRKHLSGDVRIPRTKKKRLSELMSSTISGIQNDKKPTTSEIIPSEIPHPDVILSELISAAKHPKQGHEAKISTVIFLCEFRNLVCLEKSIPRGTTQEAGEHITADLSKGKGAKDSYWTDRIIQHHSENQAFSAPDHASDGAIELDLTAVAILNSDGNQEKETVVLDNASKEAAELDAATVAVLDSTGCEEGEMVSPDNAGKRAAELDAVSVAVLDLNGSKEGKILVPGNASKRAAELDATTVSTNSGRSKKKEIVFVDLDAEEDSSIPKNKPPVEEHFPTALLLNFTSLDSIPSIRNLNAIFRRFGPIKETETEILTKSKRAKVTFQNREHAEAAFSSTGKFSIFGPSLLSYRLNYAPAIKKYRATAKQSKKATAAGKDDA